MARRYIHPVMSHADIQADPSMGLITMGDWVRIGRAVRGEWPKPWPTIIEVRPGFDWVGRWASEELVVLDTEYYVPSRFIYQVGIYSLESNECLIWDRNNPKHMPAGGVGQMLRSLISRARVISQNLQAEVLSLHSTWKIGVHEWPRTEDTMLMHSALWSELRHGLGFLASVYGQHEKVKHLGPGSYEYLRGDVVDTADVFTALVEELARDDGARECYEKRLLPLVPILCECKLRGIPIDQTKVTTYHDDLMAKAEAAALRARAYAGWPINMDSTDQLGFQLSIAEDVYGLVKGSGIRRKRTESGKVSLNKDKLAELITELDARGIIHPLLAARKEYIDARQAASLVFKPLLGADTVYPDVALHTQATGRWSYTNPPMSLIPAKYRGILSAPPGFILVTGDWSAIEGRLMTAMLGDEIGQKVYDQGWDQHTLTACDLFGVDYPPDPANPHKDGAWKALWNPVWEGKDDKRRVFAKSFRYALTYGKLVDNVPTIPGAKKLGLNDAELVAAGRRWLKANPKMVAYWDRIEKEATMAGVVRDIYGRPRRLLNTDLNARVREAKNAPLQMSVASILNETVIMCSHDLGDAGYFVMSTHDSTYWMVRKERLNEGVAVIKEVHERPIRIEEGRYIQIPFDIEVKHVPDHS